MKSSKLSIAAQSIRIGLWKVVKVVLKAIGTVFLVILPLGILQLAIDQHWLVGIPPLIMLTIAVYLSIKDFKAGNIRDVQTGNVDTWQGVVALVSILSIIISIFAFLSFVLYRFGAATYQGFPTALFSEGRYLMGAFFSFYMWQLFEVIPGLNVNEALGWSIPLQKSGFVAGVLVLSFRVVIIYIVLDVFRKWWVKSEASSTEEKKPVRE